jgi:cytochrome c-type biogenesis protein CcmH
MVQQIRGSIAEARDLAGLPPAAIATTVPPSVAAALATVPDAAAKDAAVSGTVTLAAALAGKALPTDTVFVFARPAEGSPMPLAIVRKQVKDLPLEFRLDDSLAMSPAARLSSSTQVVVGARISRTGDAMSKPGDFLAQPVPAKVGATGLKLEIAGVVPIK